MESEAMESQDAGEDAEKQHLRLHEEVITSIIRGPNLLTYYTLMKEEHKEKVRAKDSNEGATSGAKLFLSYVLEDGKEGWFVELVRVLKSAGYRNLADCVENLDFSPLDVLENQRKLIRLYRSSIERTIIPYNVVTKLNFLQESDKEQILQATKTHGNIHGARKLVDYVLRSDEYNFLKLFKTVLREREYEELADEIEGEIKDNEEVQDDSFHYMEKPEMDDCEAANTGNESSGNNVDDQGKESAPEPAGAPAEPAGAPAMQVDERKPVMCGTVALRLYQAELAESALRGENAIIVAPTDSGKTYVALAICDMHLSQRAGKHPRKVIFLAPTLPVFQQQFERFGMHYKSGEVSVGSACGAAETLEPLEPQLENNDVMIMTPQILLNGIEKEKVCSLADFSLIIFDECHHTSKCHPYNVIMQHYLRLKYGTTAQPLPQIVGLTASVGVGDNKSLRGAVDHVLRLCANLDTPVISTVQRHCTELAEFVPIAQHNIIKVGIRHEDPFADMVKAIMAKVEELLYCLNLPGDVTLPKKMHEYGTQPYENWITGVQKEGMTISIASDKELEKMLCWSIFSCTSHLRKYNDALMINDDTRSKDAMAYLDKFFAPVDSKGLASIEETILNFFKEKRGELASCIDEPGNENPKLTKLKEILRAEYSSNPATKSILFLKTRAIAEAMQSWLTEITEDLPELKPSKLIGRGKRKEHEGMTLSEQAGALDVFRAEEGSNLLIVTSVADEGLDIQGCNLVLLYDYVGNVIKSVQTRGRGRAKGSKCMLITSSKSGLAEKEKVNLLMEKVMYNAIESVQKLDSATITETITNFQKDSLRFANMQRKLQVSKKTDAEIYRFLCSKCKEPICKSSDIRLLEKTHYTVISSAFMELVQQKPHPKPASHSGISKVGKIMHKQCSHDWGITAIYKTLKLPVIKIQSFIVENENSGKQRFLKKWKDFPGSIDDFSFEEIEQMGEEPVWLSKFS